MDKHGVSWLAALFSEGLYALVGVLDLLIDVHLKLIAPPTSLKLRRQHVSRRGCAVTRVPVRSLYHYLSHKSATRTNSSAARMRR